MKRNRKAKILSTLGPASSSPEIIEKLFRDASIFLHMDATVDISHFKIVKAMFPETAGKYAGPEN